MTDQDKWRQDLEDEIARLKAQIKQICGADCDSLHRLKLTPFEERILRLLLIREFASYDAIDTILYWDKAEMASPATVQVLMSGIRRKVPEIRQWIINKPGRGYYLTPEGKHWIKAEMILRKP